MLIKHIKPFLIMHLLIATMGTEYANAQEINIANDSSPDFNETTLTGNWQGLRSDWAKNGISFEFTNRNDVFANMAGGIKRGTSFLTYTDARIRLDLEKLVGAPGWNFYTQYHSELGGKPNGHYVGSFMGVNNIEVATNTAQFSQLWLEKSLFNEQLFVLAGLYALDSEFYVTETSGIFLHPSMGIGTSIAQTGKNGPPIFPMSSLGFRLKLTSPDKSTYLQFALLDGVPGALDNPHGTHIQLDKGDGTLAIVELAYQPVKIDPASKEVNKLAMGFWRYSARFDDLLNVNSSGLPIQRESMGWYLLAERTLSSFISDSSVKGLSTFFRLGSANADINQADWSGSVGLHAIGLFDQREEDIAGIGMTYTHASKKYQALNSSFSHESMIEATYKYQVKPWASVQASLQRIFHPNMDRSLKDAWVFGTRLEVLF